MPQCPLKLNRDWSPARPVGIAWHPCAWGGEYPRDPRLELAIKRNAALQRRPAECALPSGTPETSYDVRPDALR